MPAVLLEIGYLTNPAQEKNLSDDDYLSDLAMEICRGIDDFL
jgi:N-acetylmuramoyl-L-alanine amidase